MTPVPQPRMPHPIGMKDKIQAYLTVFDGTSKPYQDLEVAFEDLFHQDFMHTMNASSIDKNQKRDTVELLLSLGTKADLILYRQLDDCTFEIKLNYANRLAILKTHLKGTFQGGQITKLEEYEDARITFNHFNAWVGLSEVKQNFEYFIELQNDEGMSLDGIGDAFDRLFRDDFIASIIRLQLESRGIRTTSSVLDEDDFFEVTSSFVLKKCEVIDESHMDVEVEKVQLYRGGKSTREVWRDLVTVEDGAILSIEPFVNLKRSLSCEMEYVKRRRLVSPLPH
eukprot:CAMPEP_0183746414 /NCGR_PEP_ID=MMETSP0737-20130205/66742_1 /TAXON_ID=385413 /ORGANISM="Thalassiosira miniscula, Strain CCMP1093" /LENGTH=281 /DNA_ID=CAMNT_0025982109 /DNA_START=469 /DNA_END=1314 /DNA_ORIENTATION=+